MAKYLKRQDNAVMFHSVKHNFELGYIRLSYRNRSNNPIKLSALRNMVKRARQLENKLNMRDSYALVLFTAKKAVYSNRIDMLRHVETVIHPIIEQDQRVSLKDAWALVMQGKGISIFTGKPIKSITCVEKAHKVLRLFINMLESLPK